jgi:cold-inducible RNA-binding protein
MGNRLYVGNLPFSATAEDVRAAFEAHGAVSDVHLVMDRDTGRSRGFAFVTMGTDEEAAAAIQRVDGTNLDGRALRVSEAAERTPRTGGGGFDGGRGRGGDGGHQRRDGRRSGRY